MWISFFSAFTKTGTLLVIFEFYIYPPPPTIHLQEKRKPPEKYASAKDGHNAGTPHQACSPPVGGGTFTLARLRYVTPPLEAAAQPA